MNWDKTNRSIEVVAKLLIAGAVLVVAWAAFSKDFHLTVDVKTSPKTAVEQSKGEPKEVNRKR